MNKEKQQEYYTTSSSAQTIQNNKCIDVTLYVIPSHKKSIEFRKGTKINFSGLESLFTNKKNKKFKIEIKYFFDNYNKSKKISIKNKVNGVIPKIPINAEIRELEIKITSREKTKIDEDFKALTFSFEDYNLDDKNVCLEFPFKQTEEPFEISSFTIIPSIVHINKLKSNKLEFDWKIEGEHDSLMLTTPDKKSIVIESKEQVSEQIQKNIKLGENSFTLSAKRGATEITRTTSVNVLKESGFYTFYPPRNSEIVNFAVSHKNDMLFALTVGKQTTDGKKSKLNAIAFLEESYSKWQLLPLTDEQQKTLKPFATSPMVCVNGDKEGNYILYFIGGSAVFFDDDDENYDKADHIVKVIIEEFTIKSINKAYKPNNFKKKWGHSVVIFPLLNDKKDVICVLGGTDGEGNKDDAILYSSLDGIDWKRIENNFPSFFKRCLAGITITYDNELNKKELWYGGGTGTYFSKDRTDIWRYANNEWKEVTEITLEEDRGTFGLFFSYYNQTVRNKTGVNFITKISKGLLKYDEIVIYNEKIFEKQERGKITTDITNNFETSNPGLIKSAYFKELTWFMVLSDNGDDGIKFSKLMYWLPIVDTNSTIQN